MCLHCVQSDGHVCCVISPQSASHFFVAEAHQENCELSSGWLGPFWPTKLDSMLSDYVSMQLKHYWNKWPYSAANHNDVCDWGKQNKERQKLHNYINCRDTSQNFKMLIISSLLQYTIFSTALLAMSINKIATNPTTHYPYRGYPAKRALSAMFTHGR